MQHVPMTPQMPASLDQVNFDKLMEQSVVHKKSQQNMTDMRAEFRTENASTRAEVATLRTEVTIGLSRIEHMLLGGHSVQQQEQQQPLQQPPQP